MIRRIYRFIHIMFPVFPAQIATASMFAFSYLVLAGLVLPKRIHAGELIAGSLSMLLFSLQLRACDELKDEESDRANFPNRPLVTGVATATDVRVLLAACASALIALNAPFFNRPAIATMFAVVMIYSFLMWRWFFAEKTIRASLPLAFLTHHPIVFLFQFYLLAFFSDSIGALFQHPLHAYAFVFGVAFAGTAWEISRKIRGTLDETDYATYSKVWGAVPAALVLAAVVTASLGSAFSGIHGQTLGPVVRTVWALPMIGAVRVILRLARFVRNPLKTPPLKAMVESYSMLLLCAALVTGLYSALR